MKKLILFLLTALPLMAVEQVTIELTVTNIPTAEDGSVFTLNADARTWTNAYAADQILTNLVGVGPSATNLFYALSAYRHADLSFVSQTATNVLKLYGKSGVTMTVDDAVTNYASWTYTTNTVTTAWNIRVPMTVEAATNQTNFASMLVTGLGKASNAFLKHWPVMVQFPSLTNNNAFTGTNTFRNGSWTNATLVRVAGISGTLGALTNGVLTNAIMQNPIMTNAVAYGAAISSPGSGLQSEEFGTGATATGGRSVAVGYYASASETNTIAIGASAAATAPQDIIIGRASEGGGGGNIVLGNVAAASATNGIAIGNAAINDYADSIALGNGVTTTITNQILLGTTTEKVTIPGRLEPTGTISNATFTGSSGLSVGVSGGVMTWISTRRLNNTALANGENAQVALNSSYVKLSGPSAVFTTAGFTNSVAGNTDGQVTIVENLTGYAWTIRNDSGYEPSPGNRIYTCTGQDITLPGQSSATVVYDSAASRWVVVSTTPARGAFGELYTHDASVAQDITDADTYYALTNLMNAGASLNTTLATGASGSTITAPAGGYYNVHFSASFSGTASSTFTFVVQTNSGGGYAECTNLEAESKQDVNSDVNAVGMNGILNLNTNTVIQVWVKSDSASDTVTIHDANLNVIKMQ